MFFKKVRVIDPKYVRWVSENLPCLVSGQYGKTESHHCLRGGYRGVGMKNDDSYVIPLSAHVHRQLHLCGDEMGYMTRWGIPNYVEVANKLYECYLNKDYDVALSIVNKRGKE